MDPILGALISAGGSLFSGFMGQSANKANIAAQQALNQQNFQNQQWFDQHHISDVVADAKSSGINPLAALGVNTPSAPVAVGVENNNSMGQGIEKAAQAFAGINTRQDELKNKLIEAQIANVNSDTVKNQAAASKVASSVPGTPPPLWTDYSDGKGGIVRLPSKDASSSMQNWASTPMQLHVGMSQIGDAVQTEYHKLFDPITGWVKSMGNVPMRGDAWRAADPSQYQP